MTQVVMTTTEASEGLGALITLAILAPPLAPPIYAAYMIGRSAYQQGHWHPLFAILLGLGVAGAIAGLVVGFVRIAPRWLTAILAGLYVGVTYFYVFSVIFKLDDIWSGAAALLAMVAAGFAGWFAADHTKQHFAAQS